MPSPDRGCLQLARCALARPTRTGQVIDASVSISPLGFCPMFVDVRTVTDPGLLHQSQRRHFVQRGVAQQAAA